MQVGATILCRVDATPELIGVDGCRGGWVVAASDGLLSGLSFTVVDDLAPVIARVEDDSALIAIDIPIGLRDDVVDAVACLVAAQRIALGKALVLPDSVVEYDARGLRMEIVA